MELKEAIEHTKNKKGMKQCVSGLFTKCANVLKESSVSSIKCKYGAGYAFSLEEMAKHYNEARSAWLNGDLETVAEFFGLYVE